MTERMSSVKNNYANKQQIINESTEQKKNSN